MKKAVAIIILLVFQVSLFAQETPDINALLNSSIQYESEGDYQKALEGFMSVGRYFEKHKNDSEQDRQLYVISQIQVVKCYDSLCQYSKAFNLCEDLLKENLTIKERNNVRRSYSRYGSWVADSCSVMGARFESRQMYNQALTYREKARGLYHILGAAKQETNKLCDIGSIKSCMYDFDGALEAYQRAEKLSDSLQYEKGLMESYIGQYKQAKKLDNEAMEREMKLKIDSLGSITDDVEVKFLFNNYKGDEELDYENFVLAELWYKKSELYLSEINKDVYYLKLRNLYWDWGKTDEALKYASLCIKQDQAVIDNYLSYLMVAKLYQVKGDSISCFRIFDTLCAAMDSFAEPREINQVYVIRAMCHSAFNDYGKALADYKKADEVLSTQYGKDDGERVRLLSLMAGMEYELGHYEESERLYRAYCEGIRKLKGESHDDYIDAVVYLANIEAFWGHIEVACKDYTVAVNMLRQQLRVRLPFFTTDKREAYWSDVSQKIYDMTPFALAAKEFQTTFTESCYNGLIFSKAFLLNSEQSVRDLIMTNGTVKDQRDYNTISAMQNRIEYWKKVRNKKVRNNPNAEILRQMVGKNYADDSISWLKRRIDRMEADLISRCQVLGDMTAFMAVDYDSIKGEMKDGEVLIDFTEFVSNSRGRVYAAFVVNNKQEYPLLKELFKESEIDSLHVDYPYKYYQSPYADTMYRLLWSPFEDLVKEGATVYYVPSQLLFQIALESLPAPDGRLLGEHYRFIRLSSARELVAYNESIHLDLASVKPNVVLYGGLNYKMDKKAMKKEARKYHLPPELLAYNDRPRGDSVFMEIPGTRIEIDIIRKIMKSHNVKVKPFYGTKGTEESFLSLNGKAPKILHLATHGFYYTPDKAMEVNYLSGYEDAMHLSGLVLAGGNTAWMGNELPDGICDGILTAADITRLDLSGTELVVLSACKTGRGQATPEGLYGLQRAFKKAGAKTIVMSLWNVSDKEAPDFMKAFYENLMDPKYAGDKRKAFDDAKLYMREHNSQPRYWAGFVMLD